MTRRPWDQRPTKRQPRAPTRRLPFRPTQLSRLAGPWRNCSQAVAFVIRVIIVPSRSAASCAIRALSLLSARPSRSGCPRKPHKATCDLSAQIEPGIIVKPSRASSRTDDHRLPPSIGPNKRRLHHDILSWANRARHADERRAPGLRRDSVNGTCWYQLLWFPCQADAMKLAATSGRRAHSPSFQCRALRTIVRKEVTCRGYGSARFLLLSAGVVEEYPGRRAR